MSDTRLGLAATSGAVVIGDVVRSRDHADRSALQDRVRRVLAAHTTSPLLIQRLEPTVGDEFQGATGGSVDAVRLCLDLRLDLLPQVDVRFGIGIGALTVFDENRAPLSQDGPAWWAARSAIETTRRMAARNRSSRTWIETADQEPTAAHREAALIRALLLLQDHLLAAMSPLQLAVLRGSLAGARQSAIAESQGVTQSAVSQALSSSGGKAIRQALDQLPGQVSTPATQAADT